MFDELMFNTGVGRMPTKTTTDPTFRYTPQTTLPDVKWSELTAEAIRQMDDSNACLSNPSLKSNILE